MSTDQKKAIINQINEEISILNNRRNSAERYIEQFRKLEQNVSVAMETLSMASSRLSDGITALQNNYNESANAKNISMQLSSSKSKIDNDRGLLSNALNEIQRKKEDFSKLLREINDQISDCYRRMYQYQS